MPGIMSNTRSKAQTITHGNRGCSATILTSRTARCRFPPSRAGAWKSARNGWKNPVTPSVRCRHEPLPRRTDRRISQHRHTQRLAVRAIHRRRLSAWRHQRPAGELPPRQGPCLCSIFHPGGGRVLPQFAAGGEAEVDAAVPAAKRPLPAWSETAPAERSRVLWAIAQQVRRHADRLALIECLDSGKRLGEAQGDVRGVIRTFEYYAGAVDKMQGDSFPLGKDYIGFTVEEPIGVAAQIIPWNYPVGTAARGIAPALAAGCTVVAKPAEQTPLSALLLAELASAAGLPAGVLNVVTGTGAAAGAALVAHPGIGHITFTGSVATGQRVMRAAADNVTRVLLELGGKSPLVVLADCDVGQALDGVLGAIYENAGQICSAGSRLIIERKLHGSFMARMRERVGQRRRGQGLEQPDVGVVNSLLHLNRIHEHVATAAARGNAV